MSDISQDATTYAKANWKAIVDEICDLTKYPPSLKPFTIFMAGSPGAGKTEFSKGYIQNLAIQYPHIRVIRLDVDELRTRLPMYDGHNSDSVQRAATLLFDKAFDRIQDKGQNVIVDSTLSGVKAMQDVSRAVRRKRDVGIMYIYEDPIRAWDYTQKREKMEGRTVPKQVFINAYFKSRENVDEIMKIYGSDVHLDMFKKADDYSFEKHAFFNIKQIEQPKLVYTREDLERDLPDTI